MAPSLIGPPELYLLPENLHHEPNVQNPPAKADPFMDLTVANFNNIVAGKSPIGLTMASNPITGKPLKDLTENLSPTFLSSGNPCLDFFFHIVPDTPPEILTYRLDLAWKHNPLITLKLICHLRGVRNTGKSDKEGFYTAVLWLHKHHPKTLSCNLEHMVDFGYFKDLPEILYRLLHGPKPKVERGEKGFVWLSNKRGKRYYKRIGESSFESEEIGHSSFKSEKRSVPKTLEEKRIENEKRKRSKAERVARVRAERELTREKRMEDENRKVKMTIEEARNVRKEKKVDLAKKAVEKYVGDEDYKILHDSISQLFAERLVLDLEAFKSGEFGKVSLAAKWCPSLDSCFDQATLVCENIAKRVFPRDKSLEYEEVDEAHYAYRIRDRLRKEVLVPLRKVLELPEIFMSSNEWNCLPYNRVPSVAMTKYKKHFLKHDKERFKEYLEKVKRGEAKLAAGALLPHEIIKEALAHYDECGEVAELQWQRVVDDLLQKGKLRNCLAICDVSGSMEGTPMDVCVALGLLISELSEDPWKGNVMTFSGNPELHKIEGDNLKTKTEFVKNMEWGGNTDFQKAFDRILQLAVNGKLSNEHMIKKLFVFSDMEFDNASGNYHYNWNADQSTDKQWDTDYEVIQSKFAEAGYEVPQIVFWNLRDSPSTPVTADQKGVAMVSGFSKNVMTLFLEEDEKIMVPNPENIMNLAISGPEFDQLVVLD